MNFVGMATLLKKEVLRFWKVSFQTVAAPILTAVLYLMIFAHVLDAYVQPYPGVAYTAFLVPGLVMMSLLQNAFANTSSSLIQSKITGNLVFVLLSPLGAVDVFVAYVLAAVLRGLVVGCGVMLATAFFVTPDPAYPVWIFCFALIGAGLLAALGLIAGIWSEKFDQLAAFQNFLIMPATFLSGVFYSIHSLPDVWQTISHFNPFFYLIDGFRYGFFGQADVSPWFSLMVGLLSFAVASGLGLFLLHRGYKLRH